MNIKTFTLNMKILILKFLPPRQEGNWHVATCNLNIKTFKLNVRMLILKFCPPRQEGHDKTCRPVLKTLTTAVAGAKETLALMTVHAAKKVELKTTVQDIKTKVGELESFLDKANEQMAIASVLSADSTDGEVKGCRDKVEAMCRLADVHKAGMMVAKKRWDALLPERH